MFSKLKMIIYRLRLKAAPRLSKLLPEGIKQALKPFLAPPINNKNKLPYEPGNFPDGINLFGYLRAQMGLGQGARLYARAIEASSIPHVFLNTTAGNISRHQDTEFSEMLTDKAIYNTNIIHINAEQMPLLQASYPASTWDKRYNIGVWLWELEVFPAEWMDSFRYLDEIWAPSTFSANAIASVSPIPVTTIPYGIYAETDPSFTRETFGLPFHKFLFLTMYDVKSIMARKNPLGAIDAFLQAFGRDSTDAGLVIKVNNANQEDLSMLQSRIQHCSNVTIVNSVLSKPGVNSLIQCCDALVSLHRSEGFGLVIAEAMFLGVPVIATNWSANTDFMNANNSCPVNYQLVDTGSDYYKSKAGQRWADPDIGHAAQFMRQLADDTVYRTRIALAGQQSIRENFSIIQSADKMKKRLIEIGVIT